MWKPATINSNLRRGLNVLGPYFGQYLLACFYTFFTKVSFNIMQVSATGNFCSFGSFSKQPDTRTIKTTAELYRSAVHSVPIFSQLLPIKDWDYIQKRWKIILPFKSSKKTKNVLSICLVKKKYDIYLSYYFFSFWIATSMHKWQRHNTSQQ